MMSLLYVDKQMDKHFISVAYIFSPKVRPVNFWPMISVYLINSIVDTWPYKPVKSSFSELD